MPHPCVFCIDAVELVFSMKVRSLQGSLLFKLDIACRKVVACLNIRGCLMFLCSCGKQEIYTPRNELSLTSQ